MFPYLYSIKQFEKQFYKDHDECNEDDVSNEIEKQVEQLIRYRYPNWTEKNKSEKNSWIKTIECLHMAFSGLEGSVKDSVKVALEYVYDYRITSYIFSEKKDG